MGEEEHVGESAAAAARELKTVTRASSHGVQGSSSRSLGGWSAVPALLAPGAWGGGIAWHAVGGPAQP